MLCDASDPPKFACATSTSDACQNDVFEFGGDNGFILRAEQVAPIQKGDAVAIAVGPTTTLYPELKDRSGNGTTVNVTASPGSGSSGRFSAGELAGANVATGAVFLLAVIGALIVIRKMRRELNVLRSERDAAEKPIVHHSNGAAPHYALQTSSPPSIPYNGSASTPSATQSAVPHDQYYQSLTTTPRDMRRYGREIYHHEIQEMSNASAFAELDASQKPPDRGAEVLHKDQQYRSYR